MGRWQFTETWPGPEDTTNAVVSTIQIFPSGQNWVARIEQDGFQTLTRILADVVFEGSSIKLKFRPTQKLVGTSSFKPGELLLELSRTSKGMVTIWHAIEPNLDINRSPGVYFARPRL